MDSTVRRGRFLSCQNISFPAKHLPQRRAQGRSDSVLPTMGQIMLLACLLTPRKGLVSAQIMSKMYTTLVSDQTSEASNDSLTREYLTSVLQRCLSHGRGTVAEALSQSKGHQGTGLPGAIGGMVTTVSKMPVLVRVSSIKSVFCGCGLYPCEELGECHQEFDKRCLQLSISMKSLQDEEFKTMFGTREMTQSLKARLTRKTKANNNNTQKATFRAGSEGSGSGRLH